MEFLIINGGIMKKILMLLIGMILLTGCEANIKYNFDQNIESNIDASFNINEYRVFANNNYGNDFGYSEENVLRENIESSRSNINAFVNNNSTFYKPISYSTNNGIYSEKYKYTYTYSNFKDNYFLNYCFDNFIMNEEKDAYYIKASGNSSCNGAKLIVTSHDRMISNNSDNVKNNDYIWNIKEKNNDIYFSISKTPMSTSSTSILYIIYFAIGIVLAFIAYILKRKYKGR